MKAKESDQEDVIKHKDSRYKHRCNLHQICGSDPECLACPYNKNKQNSRATRINPKRNIPACILDLGDK